MVEQKIAEILGDVQLAATQITQALIDVAPDALQLILEITRWSSIGNLLIGVVMLGIVYAGYRGVRVLIQKIEIISGHEDDLGWVFGLVVVALATLGSLIASIVILFNIWNWVGVFRPEIRLAKQIFDKLLGTE